ncbi:hypothetical protein M8J75_006793 [Diaphorina citri]|nr:hypothetical protein M8J75_006793 [Diaphorina citri]KAI5732070.1 hypothetical protein M8J77_020744 [Diaphorina citri]
MTWPKDVGILAVDFAFPSQYVDQEELELYDMSKNVKGVQPGKYTKGLCQNKMGFTTDREDIQALCLTVVSSLIEKYNISYSDIGHLEVGTETIVDKSKSVKTTLMMLFKESGNHNVEGIDTTNACYGGTAALFNAINWIESSSWDGRYALVVAADIAVYDKGDQENASARPTGGAGAVAMLIGPYAPLVIERGLRGNHFDHAFDFYKPDFHSEYPYFDSKLTIECYLKALDNCYQMYLQKVSKQTGKPIHECGLNALDAIVFHAPFGKLVQKAFARLTLHEYINAPKEVKNDFEGFSQFQNLALEDTYFNASLEKFLVNYSNKLFVKKTLPSLFMSNQIGNMYTASVYAGLVAYLTQPGLKASDFEDKRIGMFSYGSGYASSFYSIKFTSSSNLQFILDNLSEVRPKLEQRRKVDPKQFNEILDQKEETCHLAPFVPQGSVDDLYPGSWYLASVDSNFRRHYDQKSKLIK